MKNFLEHFASAAAPFVQHWEGLRTSAYKCPLGVWTIGYGRTNGVHEGDTCTKEQAAQWLLEDLTDTASRLARYINVPVTENQFIALVSLAYNIGVDGLTRKCPKLMRALNEKDYDGATEEFLDITNGGVPGLISRRKAEAELMRS